MVKQFSHRVGVSGTSSVGIPKNFIEEDYRDFNWYFERVDNDLIFNGMAGSPAPTQNLKQVKLRRFDGNPEFNVPKKSIEMGDDVTCFNVSKKVLCNGVKLIYTSGTAIPTEADFINNSIQINKNNL